MATTLYVPDLLFCDGQLLPEGGLLVGPVGEVLAEGTPDRTVRLKGRVLLPGLVNAHSHAFQRLLRGRFEFVAPGRQADDFWSWRDGMYRAANALDPEALFAVSRQAFLEMVLAGITSVGEFHYLHHAPDGTPYADPNELARQVIAAAREVGLRIVLLRVMYQRAGHQRPANPLQRRFLSSDVQTFLQRTEALRAAVQADQGVRVGVAPHSVRAVEGHALRELGKSSSGPLHMHVAEQPGEIEACLHEHGRRPVQLLHELGMLRSDFTAVHAIHLAPDELQLLGQSQANVCACPSTERNLGDGVVGAEALRRAGASLCLGSDSQAHIGLLEESRQLEGHLRLVGLRRAVLDPGGGAVSGLGEVLLSIATAGGGRSLGLPVGRLRPGEQADFFTVDLNHRSLLGVPQEAVLPAVMLSADPSAIQEVAVGGRLIVQQGRHPREDEIQAQYTQTLRRLSW